MTDWYAYSVRDLPWSVNEKFGTRSFLVRPDAKVGVRIHVIEPGQPSTLYHREAGQEGFLVVEGECLLIVDGEERPMKQWDYFHCPPGTTHTFVGAGDGPCVMVTLGLRTGEFFYERNELALEHGAGVEKETDTPRKAYEPFPLWHGGRPESWDDLPWNRGS